MLGGINEESVCLQFRRTLPFREWCCTCASTWWEKKGKKLGVSDYLRCLLLGVAWSAVISGGDSVEIANFKALKNRRFQTYLCSSGWNRNRRFVGCLQKEVKEMFAGNKGLIENRKNNFLSRFQKIPAVCFFFPHLFKSEVVWTYHCRWHFKYNCVMIVSLCSQSLNAILTQDQTPVSNFSLQQMDKAAEIFCKQIRKM